jgi:uncharacterized membrane protein
MADLGTLGGTSGVATAINASGPVVGSADNNAFLITPVNGVYFQDADQDGRNDFMTDLGTLGGTHSRATGINDAGQVVGYAGVNVLIGYEGYWIDGGLWSPVYQEFERAFLWQDGVMTELSPSSDYTDAFAYDINSAGQVVGFGWNYGPAVGPGFLWQNGVKTLTGQVPVGSLVPDAAQAINDAGQIVGWGNSPEDGSYHATLLTPNSSLDSFLVTSPQAATAGDAFSFTVTARSDSGTTLTDYTGTVSFSSSDWQAGLPANYTFTPGDHGAHTFVATLKSAGWQALSVADTQYTGVTGAQNLTVAPAAASRFTVGGFPSARPVGAAGSFSVTAWDAFGNQATS